MKTILFLILLWCYNVSAIKFRNDKFTRLYAPPAQRIMSQATVPYESSPPFIYPNMPLLPYTFHSYNNDLQLTNQMPFSTPQEQQAYPYQFSNQLTRGPALLNPYINQNFRRPSTNVNLGQKQQLSALLPVLVNAGISELNAPSVNVYKDPYLKRSPTITLNSVPVKFKTKYIDDPQAVGNIAQQYRRSVLEEQADAMDTEDRIYDDIKAAELLDLRKKNAQLASAIRRERNKLGIENS